MNDCLFGPCGVEIWEAALAVDLLANSQIANLALQQLLLPTVIWQAVQFHEEPFGSLCKTDSNFINYFEYLLASSVAKT